MFFFPSTPQLLKAVQLGHWCVAYFNGTSMVSLLVTVCALFKKGFYSFVDSFLSHFAVVVVVEDI